VFLGGRIGYVLFYNFPIFLNDPLYLFRVWDGGMSFHGGLIGVILVMIVFAKRTKRNFFQVADFIAPLIPFGLGPGVWATLSTANCGAVSIRASRWQCSSRARAQKMPHYCRLIRSGNPFLIPTAFCRVILPSCMSWRWKASCCSLS
jgi:prolipoprotein diacylglyceryl transferase